MNNNNPNNYRNPKPKPTGNSRPPSNGGRSVSRGAAVRAQKRSQADAQKVANQYASASQNAERPQRANVIVDDFNKLKITFLGGQTAIGEKNMQVVEWQNDA